MHTGRPGYYGRGTPELAPSSALNEEPVRCADALATSPRASRPIQYWFSTHGPRNALGWHDVLAVNEEEKEVTNVVDGKEIKEKNRRSEVLPAWLTHVFFSHVFFSRMPALPMSILGLEFSPAGVAREYARTAIWRVLTLRLGSWFRWLPSMCIRSSTPAASERLRRCRITEQRHARLILSWPACVIPTLALPGPRRLIAVYVIAGRGFVCRESIHPLRVSRSRTPVHACHLSFSATSRRLAPVLLIPLWSEPASALLAWTIAAPRFTLEDSASYRGPLLRRLGADPQGHRAAGEGWKNQRRFSKGAVEKLLRPSPPRSSTAYVLPALLQAIENPDVEDDFDNEVQQVLNP
ncbi:hypothetical protein C8R45DRAFT_1069669 [Mycena sanguinolenta]|nr:hypothetical protein C8R45DRAFT_1069669 [Mycena sanguinolenta]